MSVAKPYLYLSTSISLTRATVSCTAGMALLQILSLRPLRRHPAACEPLDQLAQRPSGTSRYRSRSVAKPRLTRIAPSGKLLGARPWHSTHARPRPCPRSRRCPSSPRRPRDRARSPASRPWRPAPRCTSCWATARRRPKAPRHQARSPSAPASNSSRKLGHGSRIGEVGGGKLGRDAKADDAGDVLGAGAPAPLLAAALDQRLDRGAVAEHERADALADRRSCAPRGSACRRRARHIEPDPVPPPERRRYGEARLRRGRSLKLPRPAESRRSRCWRPSGKRTASTLLDGVSQALSQGFRGR